MTALQWPCILFTTQKRMDDNNAPDMQCGDLTQAQLKKDYLISTVSERVDPFTLTKINGLSRPLSMFSGSRHGGEKISRQECVMKTKYKMVIYAFLSVSSLLLAYLYWLSQRPVEIVAVHEDGNYSHVLVKHFPFTFKGKLNWWMENKLMLKTQYDIPKPSSYGSSTIIFWMFGEGYKEEGKYDRFCFEDMKTEFNCIEKEAVFSVSNSKNMGVMFTVHDGTYRLRENGEIEKYIYN